MTNATTTTAPGGVIDRIRDLIDRALGGPGRIVKQPAHEAAAAAGDPPKPEDASRHKGAVQ